MTGLLSHAMGRSDGMRKGLYPRQSSHRIRLRCDVWQMGARALDGNTLHPRSRSARGEGPSAAALEVGETMWPKFPPGEWWTELCAELWTELPPKISPGQPELPPKIPPRDFYRARRNSKYIFMKGF